MTAPDGNTVVIGPWRQKANETDVLPARQAAVVAQIETLERRQVARQAAVDDLLELIARKNLEIVNLRRQLG